VLLFTFPTVGALIASRRPENAVGWILCVGGLALGFSLLASGYVEYALFASPGSLPGVEYAAWISDWVGIPALFLMVVFLFLLFPDGRLTSPLWRLVAWAVVIGSTVSALGRALGPGPLESYSSIHNPVGVGNAVGNFLQMLGWYGDTVVGLSCIVSVLSPVLRLRRARGQERQQLKWFVFAIALAVAGFVTSYVWQEGIVNNVAWFMFILGIMLLPLATAIAILRYRLYDIDVVINRTLVYGPLTATLVALYFGGVVLLQRLFVGLTGERSTLAVVASTLLIAALFNPLRRRVQGVVDRRFYRRKYDARKTLEDFSAKLRDETDLDALSDDLVGVVRETMQPAHVSLWLRPDTTSKAKQPN